MSTEQYKYENKTGRNLGLAALLALVSPNMIHANEPSQNEDFPSAIVQFIESSGVDIDFDTLFKESDSITEYVSTETSEYMEYMLDMENIKALVVASKQLMIESDQLDPEFSSIIQKNFMDLLD